MRGLDRDAEAADKYREAARLDPEDDDSWAQLAFTLVKIDAHEEAEVAARKAIELNSNDGRNFAALGAALSDSDRHQESADAYIEAIRLDPDEGNWHYGLAWAYERMERYEESAAEYAEASALNPTTGGRTSIWEACSETGRSTRRLLRSITWRLKLNPGDSDIHDKIGLCLYGLGRFEESEQAHRLHFSLTPTTPTRHYNLGDTLRELGNREEECLEAYTAAVRLDPEERRAHY